MPTSHPKKSPAESELKAEYEHWAAQTLTDLLQLNASYIRHGDDRTEPDTLFSLHDTVQTPTLGIEVTTAYYSERQASELWGNATTLKDVLDAFGEISVAPPDPDQLICGRIQELIRDKATHIYRGAQQIWLCIVEEAPLTDEADLRRCLQEIAIPGHHFNAIFLLRRGQHDHSYYAVQIA